MAAKPANANAADNAQCTGLRNRIAAVAVVSKKIAVTKNVILFGILVIAFCRATIEHAPKCFVSDVKNSEAKNPTHRRRNLHRERPQPCYEQIDERQRHQKFPGEIEQLIEAQ